MIWIRRAHLVLAWGFVAGVVLQVFLAGRGVFESTLLFKDHVGWGYMLGMLAIVLLVLAAIGRLGRRQVLYAVVLWIMVAFQSILVVLRSDYPTIAALHPVNGFGILLVSILMARDAWLARNVTQPAEAPVTSDQATSPATH
jgi:Family of unknown function (DUF6220)